MQSETEVAPETPAEEKIEQQKAEPKPKKAKVHKPKAEALLGDIDIGPKDYDRVVLPDSEDDPHWDPKLKNPVPEGVVESMSAFGWDPSSRALAIPVGDKLKIIHGKTRWRALEKANRLRRAEKKDAIVAKLHVVAEDESDLDAVIHNMRKNVVLNRAVQTIDDMTLAESIVRALSSGQEERQVAKDHAISLNDLHGYLLLTDESKCPPAIQEMLREGKISFAAATELARKAESMTKAEMTHAAEEIAKAIAGGLRVTSAQVKKAAGVQSDGPATNKAKKQLILDLQSGQLKGKFGEQVKWAAIIAMEVGLGTRTVDSFWSAIGKLAQGQTIRVDFKQYQTDGKDAPVKGQDKK